MKYRITQENIIDTYTLVNRISDELQEVSLYTGNHYSVEFINYSRHLKVTFHEKGMSYYHPIKSIHDANETLQFYKGYAQAIYDLFTDDINNFLDKIR